MTKNFHHAYCENICHKEKFTNLYMRNTFGMQSQRCCVAVNSNRKILCSKNFWNESSIQVETSAW